MNHFDASADTVLFEQRIFDGVVRSGQDVASRVVLGNTAPYCRALESDLRLYKNATLVVLVSDDAVGAT